MKQIILDKRTYSLKVPDGTKKIDLTYREFQIFGLMAALPGQTFTKANILDQVFPTAVLENTVEVYVRYLRTKIAQLTKDEVIVTRRGFGYLAKPGTVLIMERQETVNE